MKKQFIVLFFLISIVIILPQNVSWEELNSPFSSEVKVLYMSTENVLFAGGEIGFFKTSDEGENWDTLLTQNSRSLYVYSDSIWYLCTYSGIYETTDYGETWFLFGQTIPNLQVNDIAINRNDNSIFS